MIVVDIVLIAAGFIVLLLGLVGCILPVLPGPLLSYGALILISIVKEWEAFTPLFLILTAAAAVAVTVLDFIFPLIMSKKKGATKAGIWGSVLGMIAGMFLFPPFGVILGAFAGAVLGEALFNKDKKNALKAGWGVFVGTMLGTVLKLAVSGAFIVFFIQAL